MPRKLARRYATEIDPVGITKAQLKRLSKARQRQLMEIWFRSNYQDPVHGTSYITAKGGYQHIWGGPYDAKEELWSEFGEAVRERTIDELVEELETDCID